MNPRSGENPPLINNSRSQIWRAVRSHDGHSRELAFSSATRSAGAIRSVSSPPCGAIIWLVEAIKSLLLELCSLAHDVVTACHAGNAIVTLATDGNQREERNHRCARIPCKRRGSKY